MTVSNTPERKYGIYPKPQIQANEIVHTTSQPDNPFASLIDQSYCIIPTYTLESGVTLTDVPVAYKTFGTLSDTRDNVMIICHALTGSADVEDWWGPLLGPGRAFDTERFYVVCLNSLGSPYGSASPVTVCPETGEKYGPEFPLTTVRDDVNIHKLVLDDLGIAQLAVVIGGSMGGMLVLEWAYFGPSYVRSIIPLATSSRHSAWCISWGEAQRQSIYSDPKYDDGYYTYDDPPVSGLSAARMSALLTYRSRDSFESRFGRNVPDPGRVRYINERGGMREPRTPGEEAWAVHNEGLRGGKKLAGQGGDVGGGRRPTFFSAQSYLRYQGEKFVSRFDANCYIAITRKLDTHDVSRDRRPATSDSSSSEEGISHALSLITQPTLVIGIESDGLFTYAEQQELATLIPNARLATIDSPEGHDAFLIQFEEVNRHVREFLREVMPDIMGEEKEGGQESVGVLKTSSRFGEAEVDDITAW